MQASQYEQVMLALQAAHREHQSDEKEPIGWFRLSVGIVLLLLALVALAANCAVLGHFGWNVGQGEIEKWTLSVAGVLAPIFCATLHPVYVMTWQPGFWTMTRSGQPRWKRGRPNWGLLSALTMLSGVALALNFAGGIGVMSTARKSVEIKAVDAKDEAGRLKDNYVRLSKELEGIGKHRPVDEVAALINRQQQHPFWKATNGCSSTQMTSRPHTRYCSEYDLLKAELARGTQGTEVRRKLTLVDAQMANPLRADTMAADAQMDAISFNTGLSREAVQARLALLFPLFLELMVIVPMWAAMVAFRIDHKGLQDAPRAPIPMPPSRRLTAEPEASPRPLKAIDVEPVAPTGQRGTLAGDDPVYQRAVFDEFWGTRLRWTDSGQIPESQIYAHYRSMCAQRNSSPLDMTSFRRLSAERNVQTVQLGTTTWWCGVALAEG